MSFEADATSFVTPEGSSSTQPGRVPSGQCGISLIELMIALAVLSVLLGLAVPSFGTMIRDTRLATVTNEFLAALFLARSEAIRRGRRVTLCTSADATTCAGGIGWHSGWLVFEDTNGNAGRDAGELILRAEGPRPDRVRITGPVGGTMRDYVSYVAAGSTRTATGALQMGTITVCDDGAARKIVVSASGRPRVIGDAEC